MLDNEWGDPPPEVAGDLADARVEPGPPPSSPEGSAVEVLPPAKAVGITATLPIVPPLDTGQNPPRSPDLELPRPARVTVTVPVLGLVIGAGVLLGIFCTILGVIVTRPLRSPSPRSLPSERVAVVVSAVPSSPRRSSLVDRATAGDPEALRTLGERDEAVRSVAEAVAIIEGRDAAARARVDALAKRLRADPAALDAPDVRHELRALLDDPRTATRTLALAVGLPGSVGPDLLFRVWTSTANRTDATELAEMLLFNQKVRSRATPALAIALDLRRTEDCVQVRDLLVRAVEHADARSTRPLSLLANKTGCGPAKRDDCYSCLRGDPSLLDAAILAARTRNPPKSP